MKKTMPQEIAVWYLIPSIRKEIAKILVENHSLSQKEVARLLGLTDSAVSKYLNKKRGIELKFNEEEMKKIKATAKKISENKDYSASYLFKLSNELMGSECLCKLHKKIDPSIPKNCSICSSI